MIDQKRPLISVDELKLLVHKESGYKMQISDNDPLLTTIYVNLAVLGAALEQAGALQETASELIGGLPGAADREMNRAGDSYIAKMSSELIRVVKQNSGDSNAAERQKTLVWAIGSLTVLSMFMLGTGLALGSRVGLGVGFLAAISLGIGLVGGMVLCQVLIAGGQVLPFSFGKDKESQIKSVNDFAWTTATFLRAAQAVKPGLESRVAAACKHVLLDNKSVSTAAKMEKVFPNSVERALQQFRELEVQY